MAQTYHAQSDHRPPTMTVGELITQLSKHDPSALVVFRSPRYGAFGSNTAYTLDTVMAETLERREEHYPAGTCIDEETGEEGEFDAWTQVFHAWSGVVIG